VLWSPEFCCLFCFPEFWVFLFLLVCLFACLVPNATWPSLTDQKPLAVCIDLDWMNSNITNILIGWEGGVYYLLLILGWNANLPIRYYSILFLVCWLDMYRDF
jgi:hypothetical protein